MKNFRKLCAALVLTLSLALPALAGDMSAPGATATATPRQQSSVTCAESESGLGDMSAPGMNDLDPLTTLTLGLIENILSIF